MDINLKEVKNLKIVPKNYQSATIIEITEDKGSEVSAVLPLALDNELKDYSKGADVELFGLIKTGLVYMVSTVIERNGKKLVMKYPENIKEIQRRKYTRVIFDGKLTVVNKKEIKIKTEDISAGGLKFSSDTPFMVGDEYDINVELVNNLSINCAMQPIRVEENDENDLPYSISAKFKKIRSIDRIALMQYSLRLVSELANKS